MNNQNTELQGWHESGVQGMECSARALHANSWEMWVGSLEFHVAVAHHMVCQIVADVQVLNFPVLSKLLKHVLVKILHRAQHHSRSRF